MADIAGNALLTNAQMAVADRATIESGAFSGVALMERAGAAVMDVALARFSDAPQVHVLCGPGNNGGDGYVVARLLAARGVPVRLYAWAKPKAGTDAALAAARWQDGANSFEKFEPEADDLVIDAVFGAGFYGDLPAVVAEAFDRVRSAGCRVLAVDLPSGVNGDTGHGAGALSCQATITFYRKKPGHVLYPGRALCGKITVADIGVRAHDRASLFENTPPLWTDHLPRPDADTHKYARGAVAVFSGPRFATGASRLAARAAEKAGAGAVTILGERSALDVHASHCTAIMLAEVSTAPEHALSALKGIGAVVLGPGFGDFHMAAKLAKAILAETGHILVLDADGITAFKNHAQALFDAASERGETGLILTPHEGEFGRLFPDLADDETLGKLQKARAAANRANAIVVYKGADTVIAAPDGHAAINTNAGTALATAGSGDVLAGLIAGLTGQGMPVFEAACAAAWLHGAAGDLAGSNPSAENLIAALQSAFDGF